MKKNSLIVTILLGLIALFSACQSPEDLTPSVSRLGINSITAKFVNEDGTYEGEFKGVPVEGEKEIIVQIPYFYPEHSDNMVVESMLKNMRLEANLDDNVSISPSLMYMDLTQDNKITIKDQVGDLSEYIIRAEIYKSKECNIEEFSIPSLGLSGVVNQDTKTIALVSTDPIGSVLADVKLSAHASISPNPATEALDYDQDVKLTVTAFDGVTKSVYTVKKSIPNKIDFGIRAGSAKLMFAKQLKADLGITVDNLTGGIATSGDYLVLNTRDAKSVYINAKTGEKAGEINLGSIQGSLTNFYHTSDDDGNILINNLAANAGSFKIWKLSSVTGTPELFIDWTDSGTTAIGRKVSVQGSINSNAIITAGIHNAQSQFARWTVVNGKLTSHTPEIVTTTGISITNNNIDVIYTSSTDVTSDYFFTGYSANTFAWVNGKSNNVSKKLDAISGNYIPNAVDYVEFNKGKYTALNWVNSFTWGTADAIWLLDVSSDALFEGNLETKTCKAVIWEAERGKWGPNAITGGVVNGNATGDVLMKVSDNGYFLYLYFMFTNGYVVGYQFDCIDM